MNSTHVIVGAGPVGTETARLLEAAGHTVIVVTRSGRGPSVDGVPVDGIERVAADASDATALTGIVDGAAVLYNCANPGDYTQSPMVWPPLAESLLQAAERSGATLVTASSLYGYGPVDAPMVAGQPDLATDVKGRIRADMWAQAKARHDACRIQAVEVRASDYMGVGVGANGHVTRHVPTALKGRTAWVMGRPDLPHSWTDVLDVARTLVAVSERPETWGRVWHAPSNDPRTQREALTDVLAAAGRPPVAMRPFPRVVTSVGGRFVPIMAELNAMAYMFERPYVMDSAETTRALGLTATPWDEVCRRTAEGNASS